ncbi:MAG: hypothetical protein ABIE42_10085 [Candidatus Eisenbacteria bacterium]
MSGFHLVPFERGEPVEGDSQSQELLDRLTKRYITEMGDPVSRATFLRLGPGPLIQEIDSEDRDSARGFAQLLAFSALSSRSFFRHFGYWNADNFRLEEEHIGGLGAFVTVWTRMRHGYNLSMTAEGYYLVRKPDHVQLTWPVELDAGLLEALIKVAETDAWPRYWESIINFNLANTLTRPICLRAWNSFYCAVRSRGFWAANPEGPMCLPELSWSDSRPLVGSSPRIVRALRALISVVDRAGTRLCGSSGFAISMLCAETWHTAALTKSTPRRGCSKSICS